MPRRDLLNDARHWRARAEELRIAAEDLRDPVNRATALRIAEDYERLAARAEERSNRSSAASPGSEKQPAQ